jgi:endonuclease/exonuclease/phosphatase family metal-dependent hydrolase
MRLTPLHLIIFAATALASIAPATAADAPSTIKVVCWNIEWFPGKFRSSTPDQAAAHMNLVQSVLRDINPDVLLAQEVGSWQAFADLVSAVPGLQPAVVSAFSSEQTGEYWAQQLAIGSKLPVLAAWSEPWKAGEKITPRRGFSAIAAQLPGSNQVILFYSVHLKSNRSKNDAEAQLNFDTRDESVRQLLQHVNEMESVMFKDRVAGVVIGGDFNTNNDGQFGDRVIRMMEEGGFHNSWGKTPRAQRLTWRGDERFDATTFDFIFTKGLDTPQAKLLEVSEESSDHHPFVLEIETP